MAKYDYAYEKFLGATEIMATSKGSRAKRLGRATYNYLFRLTGRHLPKEIRSDFKSFIAEMTSKKPPNQFSDAIDYTTMMMHWKTAERLSKQLFSMFLTVTEYKQKSKHKNQRGY